MSTAKVKRASGVVTGAASALLLLLALRHRLPPGLDPAQAVGILLGAWNTWLTAARSLWTWPVGIAGCLIFAGVFGRAGLYGAMGMQVFYAALSVVGWRWWLRGGARGAPPPVAPAPPRLVPLLMLSVAVAAPPLIWLLRHLRDPAPGPDALAAALNLAAQFLVMRRWVENWYFWIAGDMVSVVLFARSSLPLFSVLYVMHGGMCAYGLWRWRLAARAVTV